MEEPTRLELVNSRFAIYGLTNLAMAPKYFNGGVTQNWTRGSQRCIAAALTLGYDSIFNLNLKFQITFYGARGRTWTGTVAMTGGF